MCASKERKRRVSYIFVAIIVSVMFLSRLILFADAVDAVTTVATGQQAISSICSQANKSAKNKKILSYNSTKGTLTFSNKKYSELKADQKKVFMKTALLATKESGLGVQTRNKVYNFIAEQDSPTASAVKYLQNDASADFITAREWLKPFTSPISVVMGVLSILIFVFLSLSIVVDVSYLVIPMMQTLLERGEKNSRPFGVSLAAWKANKQAEEKDEGENVISIYLKKRIPEIFLICLCLGYLISGKIYEFMVFLVDAFNI